MQAIDYAVTQDRENVKKFPHYAAGTDEQRRLARTECMLSYLSGLVAEEHPTLHRALAQFVSIPPHSAEVDAAQAQARQLAGSETFSSPAPGTKR